VLAIDDNEKLDIKLTEEELRELLDDLPDIIRDLEEQEEEKTI
jgi:hypothetical protein